MYKEIYLICKIDGETYKIDRYENLLDDEARNLSVRWKKRISEKLNLPYNSITVRSVHKYIDTNGRSYWISSDKYITNSIVVKDPRELKSVKILKV